MYIRTPTCFSRWSIRSVELAEELNRLKELRWECSELDDDRCMANYLDSEYGNNEYSEYE